MKERSNDRRAINRNRYFKPYTYMKKQWFSILLSLTVVSTATADYLQAPGGHYALTSDGPVIVADDFRLTQSTLIGELNWWGGYYSPPPIPDNFIVRLFADDGGKPGSLLPGFSIGSITKTATGNSILPLASGLPSAQYRYSASLLSPFQAQADVRYWVSIANQYDFWAWELTTSHENDGIQRTSFYSGDWGALPTFNMAFEVVTVPEPSVALLFMGGIIATFVRNKRSVA